MEEVMAVRMAYQEQEWGQIIRQRKESGLSIRNFCKENNISERQYFYWQKKIRLTPMDNCQPKLLRIDMPKELPEDNRIRNSGVILVRFRGAEIQIPSQEINAVTAVLQALKQND